LVPLIINAIGMWLIGLAGGVLIGLGHVPRIPGLTTPLGVRGFWIAAAIGMAVATIGIIVYFLRISARKVRIQPDIAAAVMPGSTPM